MPLDHLPRLPDVTGRLCQFISNHHCDPDTLDWALLFGSLVCLFGPLALLFSLTFGEIAVAQEVTKYVRYTHHDSVAYGILDGDQVRTLPSFRLVLSRREWRKRSLSTSIQAPKASV